MYQIGTSRDRRVCPGIFTPALVPGQRETGTSRPMETLRSNLLFQQITNVTFLDRGEHGRNVVYRLICHGSAVQGVNFRDVSEYMAFTSNN